TENDDVTPCVEELLRRHDELLPPVAVERVEHIAAHLIDSLIEASVSEALRLVPFDVRVHVREDGVQVATRERLVRAGGDGNGGHRGAVAVRSRTASRLPTRCLLARRSCD